MEALVDPRINVIGIHELQIPIVSIGVPYYVRILAKNKFGIGSASHSTPPSIQPALNLQENQGRYILRHYLILSYSFNGNLLTMMEGNL